MLPGPAFVSRRASPRHPRAPCLARIARLVAEADGRPDASEAELAVEHAELSRGVARDVGRLGFGRPMHQRSANGRPNSGGSTRGGEQVARLLVERPPLAATHVCAVRASTRRADRCVLPLAPGARVPRGSVLCRCGDLVGRDSGQRTLIHCSSPSISSLFWTLLARVQCRLTTLPPRATASAN